MSFELEAVARVLGSSSDEVRETLAAIEGLGPADIREACLRYRKACGGG
ncbi:MAG: hypothetical protein ACTSYO_04870 [Candidatus Ranarchaeia archaeon]